MRMCKHCGKEFDITNKPKGWMANHSRWCDLNPKRDYYKNNSHNVYKKYNIKFCKGCNKSFTGRNKYFCSILCVKGNIKHTDDTKTLISSKRKLFLKNNPDKHPWKNNNKFISEPCEKVKAAFNNKGIEFISEYTPPGEKQYAIDIALPDKMICIEINGNQHYNRDGKLLPYYQKRHDYISKLGWVVYELHYSIAYSYDLNNIIDSILNNKNIHNNFSYKEYFLRLNKIKRKSMLRKRLKRSKYIRNNYIKKRAASIIFDNLLNANINFSKFGWVQIASDIIGCKPQKVSRWFKRWYPDFYNSNCFQRNT